MANSNHISRQVETSLVIILRTISIVAGTYQLIWGDHIIGFTILVATIALMAPGLVTQNSIKLVPLEIELIFFIMILLQFIIGETLDFYHHVPYYDKFVHFMLPFFVGYISFLIAYALYKSGNLRVMNTTPLIIVIVLMTLGIGAVWEIIEYLSDTFLDPMIQNLGPLQGNPSENAITDTMNDLILDAVGGIFGALLGLRYIRNDKGKNSRLSNLVKEIASNFKRS